MTQTEAIRIHLQEHGSITSWDAIMEYGATRLSSIIFNLKKEGMPIHTRVKDVTTKFGRHTQVAEYILWKPFYFTFGVAGKSEGSQLYDGGYLVIYAESERKAREMFEFRYGLNKDGLLPFAFDYTEEQWKQSVSKYYEGQEPWEVI